MKTIETDSTLLAFPTTEEILPATQGGTYESVRFNAMQHGILSRYTVHPHEDAGEYQVLLAGLLDEHQPAGVTESHLVEELAGVIWRKRRVLMAEGAQINRGSQSVTKNEFMNSPIPAAAPFKRGLSSKINELADLINSTPDENATSLRDTEFDIKASERASAILHKGGVQVYKKARLALLPMTHDWFDERTGDGEYTADAEGLKSFLILQESSWALSGERRVPLGI